MAELNKEQWDFIYLNYMTYADPDDAVMIMDWLCNFAADLEYNENLVKEAYKKAKNKK